MQPDDQLKNTYKIYAESERIINLEIVQGVDTVDDNVRQAELIKQHLQKIFSDNPDKKFKCLVNLGPIRKTAHYPSPQARQIYAEMLDSESVAKIAIVVPSVLAQAIMSFIMHATSKKGKTKLFKSRPEAIEWLKQQ